MPGPPYLRGETVSLHTVESGDYEFVHRYWNDPAIRRGFHRRVPESREAVVDTFAGEDAVPFLACVEGDPVGLVYFSDVDDAAGRGSLNYWIVPAERENGYAVAAADLGLEYAFDERGLHKVVARVFRGNEASVGVLESLGFRQEAHLRDHCRIHGQYRDTLVYGLLADGRRGPIEP